MFGGLQRTLRIHNAKGKGGFHDISSIHEVVESGSKKKNSFMEKYYCFHGSVKPEHTSHKG